ncbi:MAG: hypothetical protein ACREVL_03080 [Solimonas sp.]
MAASGAEAGGWYVAPDYTFTLPDSDLFHGTSSSLGISFGKRFLSGPDLEVSYGEQELSLDDKLGTLKRNDLLFGTRWRIDPEIPGLFLMAGLGAARVDHQHDTYLAPTAYAGIGYSIAIPGLPNFDMLNEARFRYTRDKEFPGGKKDAGDGQAVIKVRYSTPLATPSPAPAAAVTGPAGTSAGADVAATGRTVSLRETCKSLAPGNSAYASYRCETFEDADVDGIPDSQDLCGNTIAGVAVDNDGCMVSRASGRS